MNIFYCIGTVTTAFIMSTLSAYFICSYNNYPFINPSLTDEEQNLKINEYTRNVPILIIQSSGLMYLISDNIIKYDEHTLFQSFYTLCMYFLCIEAIYYVYHRLIHKYFYLYVHKKHHTNIIIYPFDTFFLTELDDLASIVSIGLPILFIKISMIEQFIILYLYITSSYLSHSNLFWSHHYIHHKLFKYNFCILFPIFDIIFGTYKKIDWNL
jgi:sterol desaturase/sphingolipid hydroxylase (fatty acid hydroxylase superfamily)